MKNFLSTGIGCIIYTLINPFNLVFYVYWGIIIYGVFYYETDTRTLAQIKESMAIK